MLSAQRKTAVASVFAGSPQAIVVRINNGLNLRDLVSRLIGRVAARAGTLAENRADVFWAGWSSRLSTVEKFASQKNSFLRRES